MTRIQRIAPCLWFDTQAEEAARFYVSVFENSSLGRITRYGDEGFEIHGRAAGSVMLVEFALEGQRFLALNGGPQFQFNEAVSLAVNCETQDEIDHYWSRLAAGGEEGPCGWLKDRYGVSWQVNPVLLGELLRDPDPHKVARVTRAFLGMKKFDIAALRAAFDGR